MRKVLSFLGCGLVAAFAAHASAQEPRTPPRLSTTEMMVLQDTYIFKLGGNLDARQVPSFARGAVAGAGGTLRHTYSGVFRGFSATVQAGALTTMLENNPQIVAYEKARPVYANVNCDKKPDHWQCADPGSGGGGEEGGTGGTTGGGLGWTTDPYDGASV